MEDLPFLVEYAKSGRAACRGCKSKIDKDQLRLAVMVQSPQFDGKMPMWHHFDCFFEKKKVNSVGDIGRFNSIRYEDQQRIKDRVGGCTSNGARATKAADAVDPALQEFAVDYAKSSRSICRVCGKKIQKDEVRISKMEDNTEVAAFVGAVPGWRHVDCFIKVRNELGFTGSAKSLPGFKSLSEEDQDELCSKIIGPAVKRTKKQPVAAKRIKQEDDKEKANEENALKAQSKLFYELRDKLQANYNKQYCTDLLEMNKQYVPPGDSRILDMLTDCLCFGSLSPCSECNGELRYSSECYKCTGSISGWTKCQFTTTTPKRSEFKIDEDSKEQFPFLENHEYVERERVFPTVTAAATSTASTSKAAIKSDQPLEYFQILTIGKLDVKKSDMEATINSLGGKMTSGITRSTTCVISTKAIMDKKPEKLDTAKKFNVFVVSENFLNDVKTKTPGQAVKDNLLYPIGGDPIERIPILTGKLGAPLAQIEFKKSEMKSVRKIAVGSGAAVDPESGLANSASVFQNNGCVYNAVLGLVDVTRNTNSFYKLQLLKNNHRNTYYVFRAWGRVGTSIGGTKVEKFTGFEKALEKFTQLYEEKTENKWNRRQDFVKHPNRFYPLDIDFGQDDEEEIAKLVPGTKSKLPKSVQELICLIFNVEAMKKAMLEFEIDLEKMPLGKLSKNQIQKAYSVLTEIQDICDVEKSEMKLLDASNRFYTLIPHDFGLKKPPIIDDLDAIKSKIDMLDALMELEVAYKLLKSEKSDEDPIDQHYIQLKCDFKVLARTTKEYELLDLYLTQTHADTHNTYTLELQDVFKIARQRELNAYKKHAKLHNKQLLWHGSRITNFAGILSQGLKIAPPEAPISGYMFGKGIYFADMVSKSANYCFTSRANPTGLLLLCEVALGDMYERPHSEFIQKLPIGKHSTKGLGKTAPDPKEAITHQGVKIPLGHPVQTDITNSSLFYNEYIVYDVSQVCIKYLLRVKFNYRS